MILSILSHIDNLCWKCAICVIFVLFYNYLIRRPYKVNEKIIHQSFASHRQIAHTTFVNTYSIYTSVHGNWVMFDAKAIQFERKYIFLALIWLYLWFCILCNFRSYFQLIANEKCIFLVQANHCLLCCYYRIMVEHLVFLNRQKWFASCTWLIYRFVSIVFISIIVVLIFQQQTQFAYFDYFIHRLVLFHFVLFFCWFWNFIATLKIKRQNKCFTCEMNSSTNHNI